MEVTCFFIPEECVWHPHSLWIRHSQVLDFTWNKTTSIIGVIVVRQDLSTLSTLCHMWKLSLPSVSSAKLSLGSIHFWRNVIWTANSYNEFRFIFENSSTLIFTSIAVQEYLMWFYWKGLFFHTLIVFLLNQWINVDRKIYWQ